MGARRVNDPTLPPPSSRRVTWPEVAMQFVHELPVLCIIGAGAVVAGLQLAHGAGSEEPLTSVLGSALVAALVKRKRGTIDA